MRARRLVAAVLTIAVSIGAATLSAHPGAASDVVITVHTGRAEVLFTTLPASLRLKLEALGSTLDGMAAFMSLRVDGRAVPLTFEGVSVPETAADRDAGKIAVRFAAAMPAQASLVSWQTSLILGSYPLVVRGPAVGETLEWLQGPATSAPRAIAPAAPASIWSTLATGIGLGFTHVVPHGLDHMLFVLGLFLLAARARTVAIQVSVFTVAHSITLAVATFGLVSLPAHVVEPLIALSIVYVACENLRATALTRGRLALIFAFGLLHGLGFAGALASLDLRTSSFLATLIGFNIGVEAGQLTVIGGAAIVAAALSLPTPAYRRFVVRPASVAIALVGAVSAIQRL
ncbi:MAG TPA: HupE/UreJ family protein [Vicinamibacterales bacterium]|nr:HupE/UreJ family protein [Vicinamibacterales bacterium]